MAASTHKLEQDTKALGPGVGVDNADVSHQRLALSLAVFAA